MRESRRDFLRLASQACLTAALAARGVRAFAAGPVRDTAAEPLAPSVLAMPLPPSTDPSSSTDLVRRIKAITNVFEVGAAEPDYAYVEDLGDGRGYTVTQYGFCTYNTEVAQVIERYAKSVPNTDLRHFLPQ